MLDNRSDPGRVVIGVRLRFVDRAIRRLYEAGVPLPSMEPEAVHRFFEVAAVLTAANLVSDLAGLRAFAPYPVPGHPDRWSIAVSHEWKLSFTVTTNSPATASLEGLSRSVARRRSL
jgi:hypothetical protein